ncbi:MAG: hypothetical protein VKP70_08700 [Cyanobacteriota bacterium]|nr:hypothetical protein [Cyanobacteriota bacterium]
MVLSSFPPTAVISTLASSFVSHGRAYRLVDAQGEPHPVLDDLYDSLDAAWAEAVGWWDQEGQGPVGIGVEVSTTNGGWRTIRYPGS